MTKQKNIIKKQGYQHAESGWADNKVAGLKDYMFSIVIENVVDDCWYTYVYLQKLKNSPYKSEVIYMNALKDYVFLQMLYANVVKNSLYKSEVIYMNALKDYVFLL